ncbi:MAG TPA: tRNA (adenosine(37)-N6)-threonylcarbamoyltransferase complex dimerization subunit type 1 TsaB [Gaiellaceae bacterium]|nr:tRNA (adenosine(37)-N6)-threonylcarbamoyltransferase complex dimerization subunit type 1 TsaB [Gaiellaceae bacterium]
MTLAFDTATNVATIALVRDGEVLGERASRAVRILDDIDALLAETGLGRDDVGRIVVGTGPGSYTGLRMGLITARTLSFALGVPLAGISTLAALAVGAPGAVPVIDGRRGEIFSLVAGEPAVLRPEELQVRPGAACVGDGAVRYRDVLERAGAEVPPDESPLHLPWARHHAALAADFGPPDTVEPIYLRLPDAERALQP